MKHVGLHNVLYACTPVPRVPVLLVGASLAPQGSSWLTCLVSLMCADCCCCRLQDAADADRRGADRAGDADDEARRDAQRAPGHLRPAVQRDCDPRRAHGAGQQARLGPLDLRLCRQQPRHRHAQLAHAPNGKGRAREKQLTAELVRM